jgi:hypothetical protein
VVVVDVPITPGAIKFMDTMTSVGSSVGTLDPDDVSDGMYELGRRNKANMKESWSTFKEHALDIAITATSPAAAGSEQLGVVRRVGGVMEGKKLAQLPLAALYAMLTLMCMVAFAAIYYPKMYAPVLFDKAKAKLVEYKVAEKAASAATKLKDKSLEAYEVAKSSDLAAKGSDYLAKGKEKTSEAYEKANVALSNSAVANAIAEKTSNATSVVRSKVAAKLVELKGGVPPVESSV